MAELTHKERLQPSLLDRLTDEDPTQRVEPRERRTLSPTQLRESVRRDLGWILNTTHLAATFPTIAEYPLAACSVLNFGIPDLAGRTVSGLDLAAAEGMLRQAIWDFEPRLARGSVVVRGIADPREMSHNAVSFAIEADLWARPFPQRLSLVTELDLEDGHIAVRTAGERKGG